MGETILFFSFMTSITIFSIYQSSSYIDNPLKRTMSLLKEKRIFYLLIYIYPGPVTIINVEVISKKCKLMK
jgi:hypothetical protein